MKDKIHFKFNKALSPETKYMRLMEAIEEAQRNLLRARRKGETISADGTGQSKLNSKRWKKI